MHELISVIALFFGLPLFLIGWVWCIVAAKKTRIEWVAGMLLLFPLTLPLFAMVHFEHAKKPLLTTLAGTILILITLYNIPVE